MAGRKRATKLLALTRKHREAGIKAARTRRLREAGRKAAMTRKRREAARKAAGTRKLRSQAAKNPVRALSIRQPWAEMILRGKKPYELRRWSTRYRGPLVIHASSRVHVGEALDLGLNPDSLTKGAFVGVILLKDVRPFTRTDSRLLKKNGVGGTWEPDVFAWVVAKPRRISPPIKAKGMLGLIKIPPSVLRRIGKFPAMR